MTQSAFPAEPRRRHIGRGCLGIAVVVALIVLIGFAATTASYNSLVSQQEKVQAAWSAIDNQYKRRADLVPNLVQTVQGAADFERSTLKDVTEARAAVARVQLPDKLPTDEAQLGAYIQAQQKLGSTLSRLLVVAESYPQLRATEGFRALQDQLEGTENRIAVARHDYIEAVRMYDTRLRSFPTNVVGGMFGFQAVPQITIEPEVRNAPKVEFGNKGEKK